MESTDCVGLVTVCTWRLCDGCCWVSMADGDGGDVFVSNVGYLK